MEEEIIYKNNFLEVGDSQVAQIIIITNKLSKMQLFSSIYLSSFF